MIRASTVTRSTILSRLERTTTFGMPRRRQLVREGRIHNYLRMLWGKKIFEWSARRASTRRDDRTQQQVCPRRSRSEFVQRHFLGAGTVRSTVGAGAADLRHDPLHVVGKHGSQAAHKGVSAAVQRQRLARPPTSEWSWRQFRARMFPSPRPCAAAFGFVVAKSVVRRITNWGIDADAESEKRDSDLLDVSIIQMFEFRNPHGAFPAHSLHWRDSRPLVAASRRDRISCRLFVTLH